MIVPGAASVISGRPRRCRHGKAGGEQAAAHFRKLQGDAVDARTERLARLEGDAGDRCIIMQEHSRHVGGEAGDAQIIRRRLSADVLQNEAEVGRRTRQDHGLLGARLNEKACAASSESVVPSVVRSLPRLTMAAWTSLAVAAWARAAPSLVKAGVSADRKASAERRPTTALGSPGPDCCKRRRSDSAPDSLAPC